MRSGLALRAGGCQMPSEVLATPFFEAIRVGSRNRLIWRAGENPSSVLYSLQRQPAKQRAMPGRHDKAALLSEEFLFLVQRIFS